MRPLTVNRPIPFGTHSDGTPAAAELRARCALVVGETGSGKTVTLQNFQAGLLRCPDALVFNIDLGGGGLALPWLGPWLDGDMARPGIDWLAPTVEEARIMARWCVDVILRRRVAYRAHMRAQNVDKLPITPQIPAIYVVIDEGGESVGLGADLELTALLTKIDELGRGVGVRKVISTLRATSELIPTRSMRQIGIRIGMQVADETELAYLFGYRHRFDPADTPHKGCGLWRDGLTGKVRPFRSYDLTEPDRIGRIAAACEPWRPDIDEGSLTPAAARVWAERWDRVRPWLNGDDEAQASPGSAGLADLAPSPTASPPSPTRVSPAAGPLDGLDMGLLDSKLAAAKRALLAEQTSPGDVAQAWAALAGRLADDRAAGGEGWGATPGPDPKALMLDILRQAGAAGMSGPRMHAALAAAGVEVSPRTVYRWLNDATANTPPTVVDAGYGAYVAPQWRTDK